MTPLEPADTLMAPPCDLSLEAHTIAKVYADDGIPFPFSGDVIARGKAEWDRS